ncbi:MAG TPA: hypothetical protein VHB72_04205 [Candidatus Saccharimonadales bacterium]|nr:hypothetical protein [Candidatus Saccharimonadales bacterium]
MSLRSVEINSPPLINLGELPSRTVDDIQSLADEVAIHPGYSEAGRASRRVEFTAGEENATDLHVLAAELGHEYIGIEPGPGSVALISTVTNAELFRTHTQNQKAACNWHQDFVLTDRGFYHIPEEVTRLILPMQAGPFYAEGQMAIARAFELPEVEPPTPIDREKALKMAPSVIGADGVLIKSEKQPTGGKVTEAKPNCAYIVPRDSIHKTNPRVPQGRIFFQLDTVDM